MSGRSTFCALLASSLLVTTLASGSLAPADAAPRKDPYIPEAQKEKVLPHATKDGRDVPAWKPSGTRKPRSGPGTDFPDEDSATVDLSSANSPGQLVKAGPLPVRVGVPRGAKTAKTDSTQQVEVELLSGAAEKAGINGVALGLRRLDDGNGATTVALDYSGFEHAVGAGWVNRLRLVRYPECVLTTPTKAECREAQEVASVTDANAHTLTAQVNIAGGSSTSRTPTESMTVLAATAAPSGSTGDFTATSLSASGSWAQGGATGGFTWSYPLVLPPSGTGEAPPLTLNYDSQAVDGQNTTSNNQASWVGQGWSYDAGYIERTYRTCSDDKSLPDEKETDDLCWAGPVVTLNMPDGATGSLVQDDTTKEWHVQSENGLRIELKDGADNGAWHGEHWVVTDRNGTRYFFGLNRLPGSDAADATDSAWTVPVFSPRAGDPCYDATGFGQSRCNMAYRWNLDYSVDVDGNAITYDYKTERNFYSSTAGAGDPNRLGYDRGGHLTSVRYGLNTGGPGLYGDPAPQRVDFDTAERCFPTGGFTCADDDFKIENALHWPDVPVDQSCKDSGTCDNHSPTFWSRKRLTTITTKYWGGGTYHDVDSYVLDQSFSDLTDGELLLDSVTRTAGEGSQKLSAPPVRFSMGTMPNRVEGLHTLPGMYRSRLHTIFTETGQNISIAYSGDDGQEGRAKPLCTPTSIPSSPSSNTTECYPVKWKPPYSENDILDYFHKYVVTEVSLSDNNATAPSRVSRYHYVGDPAWHYDDNEVQKPKHRTWSQFRGYRQVETRTGNPNAISNGTPDAWTSTKTFYYRGMNGDRLPNNGTRAEPPIVDSQGLSRPDADGLAGQVVETQQLNGVNGAVVSKTIHLPEILRTTATRVRDGDLDPLKARIIRPKSSTTYTAKASGGFLKAGTATVYDNEGRATEVLSTADSATANCVKTHYVDNNSTWVKDKAKEVVTYETTCPTAATPSPKVLRRVKTYYDGSDVLGTMTQGKPTRTESYKTTSSWVTSRTTYDTYGRVKTSTVDNPGATPAVRTTTTTYTPSGVGALTRVDTQLPLDTHTTRRYLDPARGVATKSVAVDGLVTEGEYDAFGRLTSLWRPGQAKATDPATETYEYDLRPDAPISVATKTLVDRGNGADLAYKKRVVIYDAFGEVRQAQADAVGGGRIVTDNFIDSHGWAIKVNDHWYTTGAPDKQIITTAQSGIDDWKTTTYDGAGRPTLVTSMRGASTVTASIRTIYGGDRTTVIQPTGGVSTTAIVDGRGNQIELDHYKTLPTINGNVVSAGTFQRQTFAFDGIGQQTQMKTAVGVTGKEATWSTTYDLLGRVTSAVSPDSGNIRSEYYDSGDLKTQTDGANRVIAYDYDAVGRSLNRYTGSLGGAKVASWTYDDPALGVGRVASSTSYENGSAYTKAITGYDVGGRALGERVSLDVVGFNSTYTTEKTWTRTGQLATETLASTLNASGGGLNPEKLTYAYDALGNAVGLQGQNAYVSAATYTPYGEAAQYVFGVNDETTVYSIARDAKTRRITDLTLSGQLAAPQLEKTSYTYDAAGNVVKSVNQQGSAATGPIQTQCFRYDNLRQLVNAWSATDACATTPTATNKTKVGGQQPYWTTWAYDDAGNRTSQVKHGLGTASDTTTTYTMNTPGHPHALTSATGGRSYTYNGDGAMAKRTVNTAVTTFGYDADGSLDTVTSPTGASNYVQDAEGGILMRKDPTTTTLYLAGQEVVVTNATKAVSVHKYYEFNGANIGVRIHKGAVRYMVADLNGTNQVAVDPANGFTVTRRYMDPFGNVLSNKPGAPAPGVLPGSHGFLNAPLNSNTSLVDMGARQYEPETGRFTSVDPILTPNDPQQAQGYMYASNNPITFSDRSGLMLLDGRGSSHVSQDSWTAPPAPEPPSSFAKGFMDGAGAGSQELIDSLNPENIFDGITNLIKDPPNPVAFFKAVVKGITHYDDFKEALGAFLDGDEEKAGYYLGKLVVEISGDLLMTVLGAKAADALGDALKSGTTAADVAEDAADVAAAGARACSFSGSTLVLMADGSKKPIALVRVGDRVIATDPETGEVAAKVVTGTIRHWDRLSDLVLTNGAVLTTTEDHPFWSVDDRMFERADSLSSGERVLGANGLEIAVAGGRWLSGRDGWAYNLSVEGIHTYHVGDDEILVHNECGICGTTSCALPNTVTTNNLVGNAYRDHVADYLRSLGRRVVTDDDDPSALTFKTPYGDRRLDLQVSDADGNVLGYVETKSGNAGKDTRQAQKDAWLRDQGMTIDYVYDSKGTG